MIVTLKLEVDTADGSAPDPFRAECALRNLIEGRELNWFDAALVRDIQAVASVEEVYHD